MLSPEINAVIALPLMVKIHIVSAYVLIGMIPFTRFMHFLVYPFTYFWRRPQLVIWNYRKTIKPASAK
jgi:nitrate reductase gamma subunit